MYETEGRMTTPDGGREDLGRGVSGRTECPVAGTRRDF